MLLAFLFITKSILIIVSIYYCYYHIKYRSKQKPISPYYHSNYQSKEPDINNVISKAE